MQERFLEGRTALVTGSVQGIGLAIGKALASAGARLAVHGLATREQADAAVHTMRDTGAPDARFFDADMRKPAAIKAMMDSITAWGGPDILVNNAGIQQTASLAEVTQQIWDDILAVNLSGAFHTMRHALPEMATRGYGRVVNIASVHGLVASVNKAALRLSQVRPGRAVAGRCARICGRGFPRQRRNHGQLHLPRLDRNSDYRTANFGASGRGRRGTRCCDFQSARGETAKRADIATGGDRSAGALALSPNVP